MNGLSLIFCEVKFSSVESIGIRRELAVAHFL